MDRAPAWIRVVARAGYAARGVLYCVIGVLAARVALGGSGGREHADPAGALREVHNQPFGTLPLLVVAAGLAAYATWRLVEAILDPEGEAKGKAGVFRRIAWGGTALVHLGFVVYAVALLTGASASQAGGDGDEVKSWSAKVLHLSQIGGSWVIGLVGGSILAFGAYQLYRAVRGRLDPQLDLRRVDGTLRGWLKTVSRVGLGARGVAFAIVGVLLIIAAAHADARRAAGLDSALREVKSWSMGGALLLAIAVGLAAYGVYELLEARFRRIGPARPRGRV